MVSRTPPSSAFQDLPWNLASAIIKHLGSGQNVPLTSLHMQLQLVDYSSDSEGWSVDEAESAYSYNTDGSNYRDPETGTDTLVPLLQTCRRWQILVYKYLCATCNLTLDGSGYATVGYIPSLPKAVYRNAPPVGYALINNLVLNVDYSSIICGRALQILESNSDLFNVEGFRNVTRLSIKLTRCNNDTRDDVARTGNHIHAFVSYLKLITPRLSAVSASTGDHIYDVAEHNVFDFAELFNSLLRLCRTSRLSLDDCEFSPSTLGLVVLGSLTSLDIQWDSNYVLASQVVYNNASTLQSLTIAFKQTDTIRNLIFAFPEDKPSVFPRLTVLRLTHCGGYISATDSVVQTPMQYKLFPALVHLNMEVGHCFDDVFFRGTEGTLETLVMLGSKKCIDALTSSLGRAETGMFKKLRALKIYRSDKYVAENPALTLKRAAKFALTIASQLRVLELGNFHSAKYMVPRLQKYPNHAATLTVLKLTESIMSLDNMVELVRLLPTLTDLHCSFPGVLATDGMSLGEYLENLDSKYTPLSTVFRRLSLTVSHMVKVNGASQIALILALLCPSLCYVAVSEKMEEEFGLALRKNMSCDPFSIYACRFGILPKTSDLLHQ